MACSMGEGQAARGQIVAVERGLGLRPCRSKPSDARLRPHGWRKPGAWHRATRRISNEVRAPEYRPDSPFTATAISAHNLSGTQAAVTSSCSGRTDLRWRYWSSWPHCSAVRQAPRRRFDSSLPGSCRSSCNWSWSNSAPSGLGCDYWRHDTRRQTKRLPPQRKPDSSRARQPPASDHTLPA